MNGIPGYYDGQSQLVLFSHQAIGRAKSVEFFPLVLHVSVREHGYLSLVVEAMKEGLQICVPVQYIWSRIRVSGD